MKGGRVVLFWVVVVCLAVIVAVAQVSTSSITGTVKDTTGAVVPNTKVVATNEATGLSYSTTTTSAGNYKLDALPPGQYTVTFTKNEFQTLSSVHNVLSVGAPIVVDATLKVGSAGIVIQVESSYERIETTNAAISDVVTQREVQALPLNGRNPLNLITLEPGLVQRTTGGAGSGTHVFGSRDRSHNVTIDGIDANESSVPNPQSNIYRLNPDNVQEFRTITHNATPEFGRNSGAQMMVATKSGTNDVHGDVFYFHRNTALTANEWFNNAQGIPRPTLLLHQWGTDVGGPIKKDTTFWFFSYQGNRIGQTQPISAAYAGTPLTYSPSLRNGLFRYFVPDPANPLVIGKQTITGNSPLLVDPKTGIPIVPNCTTTITTRCIQTFNIFAADLARAGGLGEDPLIASLVNTIPVPNNYGAGGDGLNFGAFLWNPPSRNQGPSFTVRLDHKFSDRDNLFGRIIWSDYDTRLGDFTNARPRVYPGFPSEGETRRSGQNAALSFRHVFSPTVVNEFTTGFSRFKYTFPLREVADAAHVTPPPYAQDCFGGTSFLSVTMPYCNTPHTQRAVSNIQFIDNLSVLRGSHSIRMGTNIRFYRHNDERGAPGGFNMWPTVFFSRSVRSSGLTLPSNIATTRDKNNLNQAAVELLGMPSRIQAAYFADLANNAYVFSVNRLHTRLKQFNFYLQDEWKARSNVTINYGVRWEVNPAPSDANGYTFVPDHPIDGSQGSVSFVKADRWFKNNNLKAFAPRLGIAWSPGGSDKTVVRAGYGIAFDTVSSFQVTAIGGKVPGTAFQCRITVGGTTTPGCLDLSSQTSLRLSGLMSSFNPSTMPLPATKPTNTLGVPLPNAVNGVAPNVGAFDPNMQLPTVHEWSLTVQRELPWKVVGQVGYIGKRGTHLFRAYDLNQIGTNQPGFLDSFKIAQQNMRRNCMPSGTGTLDSTKPACSGGTPPAQLLSLMGASSLNGSTPQGYLSQNAAGDLAVYIDQSDITAKGFAGNYFRPNPQFTQIFYMDSGGDSYYHGLIMNLRRRFEQGLEFGLAYTFSKSIDDMSVDPVGSTSGGGLSTTNSRTPTDIHNWLLDRSVSDFDNTHIVTAHLVYDLPFGRGKRFARGIPGWLNQIIGGWNMMYMYNYQSGEPFTLNSGVRTANGQKVSRADVVGPMPSADLQWNPAVIGPVVFNAGGLDPTTNCAQVGTTTSSFCIPQPGGNGIGRNAFRGPGFWNLDMGLTKQFSLTERFKLSFRSEFFNVFNHPNFENPRNATVGSPTLTSSVFGSTCCSTASLISSSSIISTGEPYRVIQFGLKLSF
jgi:hypothetical protein